MGWSEIPLPIDPAKIAESIGIRVFAANLEEKVSGMLVKESGRDPVIFLSGLDSENRQRFSCAHELGHYVERTSCGREALDDGLQLVDYRDSLSATGLHPEEVRANKFAAALLMPRRPLERLRRESSTPAALSARFGVSLDAMIFRLHGLGLMLRR